MESISREERLALHRELPPEHPWRTVPPGTLPKRVDTSPGRRRVLRDVTECTHIGPATCYTRADPFAKEAKFAGYRLGLFDADGVLFRLAGTMVFPIEMWDSVAATALQETTALPPYVG